MNGKRQRTEKKGEERRREEGGTRKKQNEGSCGSEGGRENKGGRSKGPGRGNAGRRQNRRGKGGGGVLFVQLLILVCNRKLLDLDGLLLVCFEHFKCFHYPFIVVRGNAQ